MGKLFWTHSGQSFFPSRFSRGLQIFSAHKWLGSDMRDKIIVRGLRETLICAQEMGLIIFLPYFFSRMPKRWGFSMGYYHVFNSRIWWRGKNSTAVYNWKHSWPHNPCSSDINILVYHFWNIFKILIFALINY